MVSDITLTAAMPLSLSVSGPVKDTLSISLAAILLADSGVDISSENLTSGEEGYNSIWIDHCHHINHSHLVTYQKIYSKFL